jgi:cyclin C
LGNRNGQVITRRQDATIGMVGPNSIIHNVYFAEGKLFRRLIINDTYRTDVCLLYPPFMIAIASIYLSLVNHERVSPEALESSPKTQNQTETPAMETSPAAATPKPTNNPEPITFLANLNVDLATVASIAQEMLSFYTLSSRYLDDSGPNVAGSTSNNGNGRAKAESGVDAFFMDIDSKGSGTESPRVEKVRAKQLVEELRRMRTAKLGELDGAALGLTTSGLPGPSHVAISPITSTSTVSSGLKGTRAGQPVNKRLERAQAIG